MIAACGYGGGATGADDGGLVTSDASLDASRDDASVDAGITLSVTSSTPVAQVVLDTEGTVGWIHWTPMNGNPTAYVTRASAPNAIPPFTTTNMVMPLNDWGSTFQWLSGVPVLEGNDRNGVSLKMPYPPSLTMALPATPQSRRLALYVGVFSATAQLTVTLGGQTAAVPPFDSGNNGYIRYAIDFAANSAENLAITWTLTNSHNNKDANITLAAATLAVTP